MWTPTSRANRHGKSHTDEIFNRCSVRLCGLMSSGLFGRALRDARRRYRLNQRAFGKAVGVSQSAVTQWEHGTATPTIQHVFAAERVLGMPSGTLAGLLGFGPPSKTPPFVTGPRGVVDAMLADDALNDEQRQLLIGLYRQLCVPTRRR